jgi:pyruvate formate lyase activating enzyme
MSDKKSLRGLIFDIQGFSVHDGPGCRSLIFMKGCPLRCKWCANPEGMVNRPQLMYNDMACARDYACIDSCGEHAISVRKVGEPITIERSICERCNSFECVEECYKGALRMVGRYVTVQEMMRVISRDRNYWGANGGITLTGGEPLAQPEFVTEVLRRCRSAYIHTAIETSGHVPWEHYEAALKHVDWVFFDLKHMNSGMHRKETGVANDLILENARRLASLPIRMIMRVPVIPGFNDSEENMIATAEFIKEIKKEEVNLLPFHKLGMSKYEQLGIKCTYEKTEPPSPEQLKRIQSIFNSYSLKCYIGSATPF